MTNLVSRAEYKNYMNISKSTDDTKIDQLCTSISALVKTYCGVSFIDYWDADKTEYFNINATNVNCVFLDENPIRSITSVSERTSRSQAYTVLVGDGTDDKYEYEIDLAIGILYRTNETGYTPFPKGIKAVEVTYKSGYVSTPNDLKLAIFDMIRYYLNNEYKDRQSVVNASIVNSTGSSIKDDTGFPDHITRVLDLYKVNV